MSDITENIPWFIALNENICSIKISLQFVPTKPTENK